MNLNQLKADLRRVLNQHGYKLDVGDGMWLWRRDHSNGFLVGFSPLPEGVRTRAVSIELKEMGATPVQDDAQVSK